MSLSWFIFIIVVIIVLQSQIYRKWGLSGLSYTRSFNMPAVFEGEEVEMVEVIQNRKLLPIPWLRIEAKMSPYLKFTQQSDMTIKHDEFHKSFFSLMPFTGITRRHKILCLKRGFYQLSTAAMTCGDAFGAQELYRDFHVDSELLVYPKLFPLEDIPFPSHSWMGEVTVRRWILEDPFLIAGVREYKYGDPLNRINWKASARTGDFQVFQLDHTADPRILILLNIDLSESMWGAVTDLDLIERGISYSATIAQNAIDNGIPVGFGSNAYEVDKKDQPIYVGPQPGQEQLNYIFEILAKMVVARSCTFFTFLEDELDHDSSPMDILLLTPFVGERMEEQIQRLRGKGHSVDIIMLDTESQSEVAV
ncbi:MAG: DUF58 domain-containing protein [Clostridiales bacterium]|jgi:uncharacterized protein (DUF58 family)|nr:DUF58 domain-containing protein [Clostridiales bacterium]